MQVVDEQLTTVREALESLARNGDFDVWDSLCGYPPTSLLDGLLPDIVLGAEARLTMYDDGTGRLCVAGHPRLVRTAPAGPPAEEQVTLPRGEGFRSALATSRAHATLWTAEAIDPLRVPSYPRGTSHWILDPDIPFEFTIVPVTPW